MKQCAICGKPLTAGVVVDPECAEKGKLAIEKLAKIQVWLDSEISATPKHDRASDPLREV